MTEGNLTKGIFSLRQHGVDERIGNREYEAAIRAYRQIVIDVAGN